VWVEPRWVQEGSQWVFYEGHWTLPVAVTPTAVYEPPPAPAPPVVATIAPPAEIVEVRPAIPFAGAIWIGGHWHWTGAQYVWVAGRWSAPRAGFAWVPGHWRRGGGTWTYVPGHWRHV